MARPKSNRLVMKAPTHTGFKPCGKVCGDDRPIQLKLDEYESIRLVDYEEMQQSDAAEAMGVSRPTLTRIYDNARKNVAKALVEGRAITIQGDNLGFDQFKEQKVNIRIMNQKIAIPTNEGKLFGHFGKAPQVTIVTVENGQATKTEVVVAPEHEHGSMPKFIAGHGCTDVICGGLGMHAKEMLNELGIQVHSGAPALPIEEIIEQYLNSSITYGESGCSCTCSHHGHGH